MENTAALLAENRVTTQETAVETYGMDVDINKIFGNDSVLSKLIGSIFGGTYSYDGTELDFALRHGFPRYMKFDLTAHSEKSMTFSLRSDCETKAKYPFDFEFSVRYDLLGNKTLGVTYTVRNISAEKEMIFAVGGHPGFRVPINAGEKFEDYYLEFPEKSYPERYFPTDDGFMKEKPEAYSLEEGVRLSLRHDLFDNDAVVLAGTPKTVCLKSKNGSNGVKMNFDGFGMLGIWHTNKSDAPFVCLEPWNGHTAFVGEIQISALKIERKAVSVLYKQLYKSSHSYSQCNEHH